MIEAKDFYNELIANKINFFAGVPDSLLKDICAYIADHTPKEKNIIAANEGAAIALGTGYHLATGKIPLIYMQNSGIGNAVNPLLSLADKEVYSIPMILLIGWRGEPGVKDEPQHIKQGRVTTALLERMEIPYLILDEKTDFKSIIETSASNSKKYLKPVAILVRKSTFTTYKLLNKTPDKYGMTREEALHAVLTNIPVGSIIVSTTGMLSRELFEQRKKNGQGHQSDFLTVGSMGHASQIALGIALEKPERHVYCFDGDGASIMHTGSMGIIGDMAPANFTHILFNNGAHDSVGGQPTIGFKINFSKIAEAFNYKYFSQVSSPEDLNSILLNLQSAIGPSFLEVCVNKGARKDLGRPTTSPVENKNAFMENLNQ